MKKILNAFSKEKLQKFLFLGLIVLVFGVFIISIIVGGTAENENPDPNQNQIPNDGGNTDINDNPQPSDETTIEFYKAPCDTTSVSILRHFYSVDSDTVTQEMSLIQYGNKYILCRGVTYTKENSETFNCLATLSGTVSDVSTSTLYGGTIIIDHGDGIKSEYIGVTNILVEIGDTVKQGDIIATSGTAEYDALASNHLHFRISVNGKYYDPEKLIETKMDSTLNNK